METCRICKEERDILISPCQCSGSLGYHKGCMEEWLARSRLNSCEICKQGFFTRREPRSMGEWLRSYSRWRVILCVFSLLVIVAPVLFFTSHLLYALADSELTHPTWSYIVMPTLALLLWISLIGGGYFLARRVARAWSEWRATHQVVSLLLE